MKLVKKKLCFDIDGVICKTKGRYYSKAVPNYNVIKLINILYENNKIIIFTARYMGRNDDNIALAKRQGYIKTYNQLKKWGLQFHELRMGKPSFDLFIDDKNFLYSSNWLMLFKKKYKIDI